MELDRKKEVINICLDHFIVNGLAGTSTRSLSSALKLQNAGLYYYFTNKDEAVILCAEEAAIRLENNLIAPAMHDLWNPEELVKRLYSRASEMAPTMRFFVSVCVSIQYKDEMKPVLDRLSARYDYYAESIAKKLGCKKEKIESYVYMTITSVTNYMIFGEDSFIIPQMESVKKTLKELTHA